MNYWVITDTHFGHKNIAEYCGRPDNFEEIILNNISKCILSKEDILVHLGDICFGRDAYWHDKIMEAKHPSAPIWLLRGNHESKSDHWYLSRYWNFVGQEIKLKYKGKHLVFSHKPVQFRNDFDINIHGHLHNNGDHPELTLTSLHRLVHIEDTLAPVRLEDLL